MSDDKEPSFPSFVRGLGLLGKNPLPTLGTPATGSRPKPDENRAFPIHLVRGLGLLGKNPRPKLSAESAEPATEDEHGGIDGHPSKET